MGGGPKTHTETTATQLPQWYMDEQKGALDQAGNILKPGYEGAKPPTTPVAPMNADQNTYANMMRHLVGGSGTNYAAGAAEAGQGGAAAMPFATNFGTTSTASPAALVSGGHIQSMANPFTDMVTKAANERLNRQNDREAASIGSRAAQRGAFSGSGSQEALERVGLAENMLDTATETEANLRSAAYDRATDAAFRNADQVNNSLGRAQQVAMSNTNSFNEALSRATGTAMDSAQLNMNGQAAANSMQNDFVSRMMQIAGGLKGVGDSQQGQAQREIDAPLDQLSKYMQLLNGGQLPQSTTSTQPVYDNNGGLWGTLAALAGTLLSPV